jgi:SAM-dependent methyltransferase
MAKFLIHPSDLERRRKRCAPEVARLVKFRREVVVSCNVCGSPRQAILNSRDRYGLPFRNALCLDCGLFYLVDRFEFSAYSDFYATGAYRTITCQFNGVTHTMGKVQSDQVDYAKSLVRVLSGLVPVSRSGKLLDVGGSAGIVAREVASQFGMHGVVLDPASDEIDAARAAGLDAYVGSVEDWETPDRFDLILLCRSIEHLFDLRLSLSRIRSLLTPQGLFYCDIADFMEMCRIMGAPETFVKADHCYWLTQSTALRIFQSVGFEILSMNIVFGIGQVGFLLRACEPQPLLGAAQAQTPAQTIGQVEEIRKIEREWRAFGGTSLGPKDWLRRKAYRVKRRLVRLIMPQRPKPAPLSNSAAAAPATSAQSSLRTDHQ